MLNYSYCKEIFQEVPGEITLGISISGCKIHCPECHSKELWEDIGSPLTVESVETLLQQHRGISCICFLGGEHDIDTLIELCIHFHRKVKTAWYCGLDTIPRNKLGIENYLDYLKLGHYDKELGGLDSPTTNQRFYRIEHIGGINKRLDWTYLFWKKHETSKVQR